MTGKEVRGVVGVVDERNSLEGVITDGDIRRKLEKGSDVLNEKAEDLMSTSPKTIDAQELAAKAQFTMEQLEIQVFFVLNKSSQTPWVPVGLVHIHDLTKVL